MEMILTVSIIVLLLGFLFLTLRTLALQTRLQSDLQEISDLIRSTRFRAITDRLPWRLHFSEDQISAHPPQTNPSSDQPPAPAIQLDPAVQLRLRVSADQPWEPPSNQTWRFDPTGVVGPMQLRLAREDAYVEVEVDPLTGRFLETGRHLQ